MKMEKNPISKVCTSNQGEDTHGLTPWSRSSKDAEESFTGDGLLHHMDTDTMHRLQMQVLQDEEFADDMRALLLARFRAKHRSNSDKQDLSLHDTSESSDSEEELEASKESSAVSKDVERLKALGYVLGPHEKLLLKGKKQSEVSTYSQSTFVCDEEGVMSKLEEIKYAPPRGMRRVPFVETLAICVKDAGDAATGAEEDTAPAGSQIGRSDDLKREAHFIRQVQETVPEALRRLRALGLQISRPVDFLAEMLKSDSHMGKIRKRAASELLQQQQFEQQINRKLNKKFNKLSGHQLVREQEEARRRNIQLKAIDEWKKEREESKRTGQDTLEAEDAFDAWLRGNDFSTFEKTASNHGHIFKTKDRQGKGANKSPSRRKLRSRRGKSLNRKANKLGKKR